MNSRWVNSTVVAALLMAACQTAWAAGYDGKLTVTVNDEATGQPIAARMELRNGRGRPVRIRSEGAVTRDNYVAFEGQLTLELPQGSYRFFLEAGPEFHTREGHFTIERHAEDATTVPLKRHQNMGKQGWFAGDVDVHHPAADLELLQRAAGISLALALPPAVVPAADAWELPVAVAEDKLLAVQVMNRGTLAGAMSDAANRPADKTFYPGRSGRGRFNEAVYHHLLNCGLRIPPAAGSGSGENDAPVGTNRVYVDCGDEFVEEDWLDGLRSGRVVVTNGPLLRTSVEGQPPGAVFHLGHGEEHEFEIALSLSFYRQAPVEYLEIVKNGSVEYTVRLDELAKQSHKLPPLNFDSSGWFLVRAVTNNTLGYQYASTGPYYVEAGYEPRISKTSVEFFLKWLDEAAEKFSDDGQMRERTEQSRAFWNDLHTRANAE